MYVSHYLRILLRVDIPLTQILGTYASYHRIVIDVREQHLFAYLHDLWVFYENFYEDDSVVQDKILSGEKPFIDPKY